MRYTSVFRQKIIAMPKFKGANMITYFLLFLPVILLYRPYADSNTFLHINEGRHIISYGTTAVDPFILHTDLRYPMQNWLSSVIFYKTFSVGQFFVTYLTILLTYFYITVVLHKLIVLLSEKNIKTIYIITMFCNICLGITAKTTSQVFSIAIIVTAIFCLEKAIRTGDKRFLYILPLLSVLLINLDATQWVLFLILLIPYIIDGLNIKNYRTYEFLTQHMRILIPSGYGASAIMFFGIISFLCGCINPFGLSGVNYALKSYAITGVSGFDAKMHAPDFSTNTGIALFMFYTVVIFTYIAVRTKSRLRYMLMAAGSAYLGLVSVDNVPIFIVCTLPFIAFHIKDIMPVNRRKVVVKKAGRSVAAIFMSLLVVAFIVFNYNNYVIEVQGRNSPVAMVQFIKANSLGNMRLFNEYSTGGYLEYHGIKPFIDAQMQKFYKKLNGKEDIISDYSGLYSGTISIKQLFEKYDLNYALVENNSIPNMQMKFDDDFSIIQQDDEFSLYRFTPQFNEQNDTGFEQ